MVGTLTKNRCTLISTGDRISVWLIFREAEDINGGVQFAPRVKPHTPVITESYLDQRDVRKQRTIRVKWTRVREELLEPTIAAHFLPNDPDSLAAGSFNP